ncbi:MAG TPA: ATP-binding protein [Polyangiaceae bacterium]|nr:ATP-binding protein [Polyangiaceae bacterium]
MLRRELRANPERFGLFAPLFLRFVADDLLDEEAVRNSLVAAAVGCLFTLVASVYTLLALSLEPQPPYYYVAAVVTFLSGALALALLRKGQRRVAVSVLLIGGSLAICIPFAYECSTGTAASNFCILLVIAGLLVGWRGAVAVGSGASLLIIVMAIATHWGLVIPKPVTSKWGLFPLMQLLAISVMLVLFDRLQAATDKARRELESRLQEAQRLEAVGRLAGGIAHDFNNLLFVILANTGELSSRSPSAEAQLELTEIKKAADRATQLVQQLLAFSKRQIRAPATFDLGRFLEDERPIVRRLLPTSIALDLRLPPRPIWVHADAGQLSQVLLNLTANARDAMPHGGKLSIELGTEIGADPDLPTPLLGAELAALQVSDNGAGMNSETLARAFEPFFTTKGPGAGTGLGLASVHGIVSQSGGFVRVSSKLGSGTKVLVRLPTVSEPTVVESSTPPSEAELRTGSGGARRTILLIEDDDAVRSAATRILSSMGHRVLGCADTTTALDLFRKNVADIDLVVSDVMLSSDNGPDLLTRLLESKPLRALFISGYPGDLNAHPLLERAPLLRKPFTHDELAREVSAVLDGPALER